MAERFRTAFSKLKGRNKTEVAEHELPDRAAASTSNQPYIAASGGHKEGSHGLAAVAGVEGDGLKADDALKQASVEDNAATDDSKDAQPDGQAADAAGEEAANYLKGTKLALLTLGLALATFVIALDNTIIATAIPRITDEFDSLNVGCMRMIKPCRAHRIC